MDPTEKKQSGNYTPHISIPITQIPHISTDQMREVDRLMIEEYGIQLLQMMENAGTNLAKLVRRILDHSILEKHVTIVCGKGNNGGGGMVAARHLHNWGAQVTVLLESDVRLKEIPIIQWNALKKLPLERIMGDVALHQISIMKSNLIIDALIGYGLSGAPRGWTSQMIRNINSTTLPVIALDVPSGFNASSGKIYNPCINATATLTLALPKTGLINPIAKTVVGELYLADISVPKELYHKMGIKLPHLFNRDSLIHINLNEL